MKIQDRFFKFLKKIEGEVGIEIEVEGEHIPKINNEIWRTEEDGSLKSIENCEYVLNNPVKRYEIDKVIKNLTDIWKDNNTVIHESHRAGIHVHINVRDLTLDEVIAFALSYYIVEDILIDFCGEDRVGNLFCLRSSDAEWVLIHLKHCLETDKIKELKTDAIRYSSLNYKALLQYGSLEFRGMRSTRKLLYLKKWVKLLLALKDYSIGKNPKDIIFEYSIKGAKGFYQDIFGGDNAIIKFKDEFENSMSDGIRRIQDIAYCKKWDNEKKFELKDKDCKIILPELNWKPKRKPIKKEDDTPKAKGIKGIKLDKKFIFDIEQLIQDPFKPNNIVIDDI